MNDIATRIAEKIARLYFAGDDDEQESQNRMTARIRPFVSTELEPVMEVLRDILKSGRRLCAFHRNVETGNYLHCLICGGESPGGDLVVESIRHETNCWISQARKLIDEEKQ